MNINYINTSIHAANIAMRKIIVKHLFVKTMTNKYAYKEELKVAFTKANKQTIVIHVYMRIKHKRDKQKIPNHVYIFMFAHIPYFLTIPSSIYDFWILVRLSIA